MRNISGEFKRALFFGSRKFLSKADFKLADGTKFSVGSTEIMDSGLDIDDAISSDDDFTALGSAVIGSCTLKLYNNGKFYSDYTFEGAEAVVYTGLALSDGTPEWIKMGTYTVDDPTYGETVITLSMLDHMERFDQPYRLSTLIYPATLGEIVRDACTVCGVPLNANSLRFPHYDYVVQECPTERDITFREIIAWAATVAGCYARCDADGKLELKWFNTSALEDMESYDGGAFDPYTSGNTVDGGGFSPWTSGNTIDAGAFSAVANLHYINSLFSQDLAVDDVVITGVRITVDLGHAQQDEDDVKSFLEGTTDYCIDVKDNPFITESTAQTVLGWLATELIGLRFRKCNVSHVADPSIEAGDVGYVWDSHGDDHPILITRTTFSPSSQQTIVCGAAAPLRHSSTRFAEQTRTFVELRKQFRIKVYEYDQVIAQLQDDIENASGMYQTTVTDSSGASLTYYHNKQDLENSDIRILISSVGITVTSNGTDEHPIWYGLRVDGEFIASIMNTIGINFDWGVGGELVITKNGNETFYANADTGVVRIVADSFSLSNGDTINSIAEAKASSAVNGQTQQSIFNKLTNNGQAQGIYLQNGKLYLNFAYAVGQTLKLGGSNNANGLILVYDSSGNQIGKWGNDGLSASGALQIINNISDAIKFIIYGGQYSYREYLTTEGYSRNITRNGFAVERRDGSGAQVSVFGINQNMHLDWRLPRLSSGAATYVYDNLACISLRDNSYDYSLTVGLGTSSLNLRFYKWYKPSSETANANMVSEQTLNFYINGKKLAYESSSSIRYKHNIKEIRDKTLDPHKLLALKVVQFEWNEDHSLQYADMRGKTIPGIIAEDVAEIYPAAVIHDPETGEIESWDERRILPGMLALIQEQDKTIKGQQKQINDLAERVEKLEKLIASIAY